MLNLDKNHIFRAYDIRGKYPNEINEKIVTKIISLFISKLKTKKSIKIVIGHDCRLSSPFLYKIIKKNLEAKNYKLKAVSAGLITTPMLSFFVSKLKADYGIMITASHNPKEYNGLKIIDKNVIPISGKEILRIINN